MIAIPIDDCKYVIIKKGKVIREAKVCGALTAIKELKPKRGEELYIKVNIK